MPRRIWLLLGLAIPATLLLGADDPGEQLLAAARKGDAAAVKQLLDQGANVNSKNRYGSTALFFACDRGHFDVVKLLVERGADMNVKDTFYNATALSWAMSKKHENIVNLLVEKGVDVTDALQMTVQSNDQKLFRTILDRGTLNKRMLDEALLVAQVSKRDEMAKTLESLGAKSPEIPMDEATVKQYAGKYQADDSTFTFVLKDGKLAFSQGGGSAVLIPTAKNEFRFLQAGLVFQFERGADGAVKGVSFESRGGAVKAKKVE